MKLTTALLLTALATGCNGGAGLPTAAPSPRGPSDWAPALPTDPCTFPGGFVSAKVFAVRVTGDAGSFSASVKNGKGTTVQTIAAPTGAEFGTLQMALFGKLLNTGDSAIEVAIYKSNAVVQTHAVEPGEEISLRADCLEGN